MLSPALLDRIEALLGTPVLAHRRVQGGYTPALRLVCTTADGSVFVKAGVTPRTAEFLRQELTAYAALSGDFLPTLIAADAIAEIPLLLTEDLSACDWPPPWSEARIAAVVAQIHRLHATPTTLARKPALDDDAGGWAQIAQDPTPFLSLGLVSPAWLDACLPRLLAAEHQCPTGGDALCHGDLRSDNLCLGPRGVVFVDWNCARPSNPELDLGFWLPSLQFEGGPAPETILPEAPGVAARVSGYFAARAGLPLIPDAPLVRRVQREQLSTALPWAIRALALRPVTGR